VVWIVRVIDQIDIFKFTTGNFQIIPGWRAPRSPTIGNNLGNNLGMGDVEYGKIRDIYSRWPTWTTCTASGSCDQLVAPAETPRC
jgi:hypothetical protein